MKKAGIIVAAILLFTAVFGAGTAYAHDAEYGMRNGEQNGLLLGEVEEAGEDWVILKDVKALPSGDKGGVLDRQLPLEEVPERLKVTELRPYLISYSGSEQPQAGQYMMVSADLEENGDWKALWRPYEVSSLDPSTLEFQPEGQKTIDGFAWEWFVHSGGAEHDFCYEYGDDVQTLYLRRVQADGSKKNEVIFQVEMKGGGETTDGEAADSMTSGGAGTSGENSGGETADNMTSDGAATSGENSGGGTSGGGTADNMTSASGTAATEIAPTESSTSPSGLTVALIAAAFGFFGGMIISRLLKKNKKH